MSTGKDKATGGRRALRDRLRSSQRMRHISVAHVVQPAKLDQSGAIIEPRSIRRVVVGGTYKRQATPR